MSSARLPLLPIRLLGGLALLQTAPAPVRGHNYSNGHAPALLLALTHTLSVTHPDTHNQACAYKSNTVTLASSRTRTLSLPSIPALTCGHIHKHTHTHMPARRLRTQSRSQAVAHTCPHSRGWMPALTCVLNVYRQAALDQTGWGTASALAGIHDRSLYSAIETEQFPRERRPSLLAADAVCVRACTLSLAPWFS